MRKLILTVALLLGAPLHAQTALQVPGDTTAAEPRRVESFGDWAVFVTDSPRECFATSRALAETGWPADAIPSHGAQILVTFRPRTPDSPGEVSFWSGGRPITPGSTLTARTATDQFPLFSDQDWAWPPSAEADRRAIAAFSSAPRAEILLLTAGTIPVTTTFSLDGFGPAVDHAQSICSNLAVGS